ncbi:hypothetical protein Trydic_g2172 [Trypoxylus dichotomus]
MSEAGNDDTENPNLVSGEYSGSSSDDGDNNSGDDADDIGNPIIASMRGYIAPSGLVWSLEYSANNKIAPRNITRRAPGLPRKRIPATPKEAF